MQVKQTNMDESVEEAQISIHCGGTDIYIVPNGKSKHVKSPPQELENHGEQELLNICSPDIVYIEDNGANGKTEIENTGGHHLLSSRHVPIKTNGKKNGKTVFGLERAASTELVGNNIAVGSLENIIERERLEEAIIESEERRRAILREIKDAYFEVDLHGNFTSVNDSLCSFLGYTKEELLGTNFRYIVSEKDAEAVYLAFNQVYRAGRAIKSLTYEVIHKDGTTLIAETSASPLRNVRGEVIGFRGIGHDITERKRTEKALRWAEEIYRNLLDEIEECYYEVDLAGNFTFVNNAICRQFGYSREELIGMNYRFYVPKEDIDSIYKTWNKVYRTGESLNSYHFASINKGRTQIFLENSVSLLQDHEGKTIGFRSICRDVTERKQFMQNLAELTWPPLTR